MSRTTIHWTDASFKQRISELYNNEISVNDTYNGIENKISFHCNVHNCDWVTRPSILLRGQNNCPETLKENKLKRQTKKEKEFLQIVSKYNTTVEIIGKYDCSNKKILTKCKKCGYEWMADKCHLRDKKEPRACPVCAHNLVVNGINDIATTHPHLVKYFKNPKDATKYSIGSNQIVDFKCPDCGQESKKTINSCLSKNYYVCHHCTDSISYPNKFCRKFLSFFPIKNLKTEWNPNWGQRIFYDNYFEYCDKKYILEADGEFHTTNRIDKNALEKAIERDRIKDRLAKEHGIELIRIDCKKSTMNYIKTSIENSYFAEIFDLSIVDWNLCNASGCQNIAKEICDFFHENHTLSAYELSDIFNISVGRVRNYLNMGNKLGWCVYNNDIAKFNSKHPNKKYYKNQVIVCDLNGNELYHFKSPSLCERYLSQWYGKNFSAVHISNVCNGIRHTHQGFKYKFFNEYNSEDDFIIIDKNEHERRMIA